MMSKGELGLPWHSDEHGNLCTALGRLVVTILIVEPGKADFVLAACNSHHDLLAACKALVEDCLWTRAGNGFQVESRSGRDIGVAHMLADARAAITKAEKEAES